MESASRHCDVVGLSSGKSTISRRKKGNGGLCITTKGKTWSAVSESNCARSCKSLPGGGTELYLLALEIRSHLHITHKVLESQLPFAAHGLCGHQSGLWIETARYGRLGCRKGDAADNTVADCRAFCVRIHCDIVNCKFCHIALESAAWGICVEALGAELTILICSVKDADLVGGLPVDCGGL